jgi:epsilon-lactone hydrolase
MASPESEALKTLYRGWAAALAANPEMPLDELRLMFEHWGDVTAEPGGVDYIETNAGGVPALWAVPKGCAEDRVVPCLHGGGYVTASMYTHRKVYGHLAKTIGCRALILHYRRAPEHVHPAPVDDAVTAYRWLLDQGIAPGHIALTGDSAGGALAVTTLLRARERNLPMPAATMPLSPWVDMEITGETLVSNREKDAIVQKEVVEAMATTFLGEGGNRKDPLANPLYAGLKACRRCTFRWVAMRRYWTTAAGSPSVPERPASTSGWTCSRKCSTSSTFPRDMRRRRTMRSANWPSGCGRSWASPDAVFRAFGFAGPGPGVGDLGLAEQANSHATLSTASNTGGRVAGPMFFRGAIQAAR